MDVTLNNSTIAEPVFTCVKQMWWCQESFRSAIYISAVATIIANVLLALTAVLSNGLIFFVYYQNESLRKPANTILLSLAVTDFLTGAVSQPLFIYEKVLILTNCTERICMVRKLKTLFTFYLFGATLLNLSVTTLDRYIAVLHSFRYLDLVTNSRVRNVLLTLWLVWIGIASAGVLSANVRPIALILVPSNVIFICIVYYKISREIRRLAADPVVAANETEEARKEKERRSFQTVATILGLFFFCYFPIVLYLLVFYLTNLLSNDEGSIMVLNLQLFYIAMTFASSNSSLNIFVYFWKNTEIRSAMLKVVRTVTQRFRTNEVNPI